MKSTRREYLLTYTLYDRSRIEAHLEKMAKRGWLLERIGPGGWRYRRIEPQSLRFSVVYFPRTSQFAPIPSEGLETFRDYCASAGWTFAADSAQMQVFYTEDENAVPIETDPAVELSNIRRSIRRTIVPLYLLLLLEVLLHGGTYLQQLQNDAVDVLSSSIRLVSMAGLLPLLVMAVIGAVRYGLWLRRAKRAAEAALPLPPLGSGRTLQILIWVLVGLQLLTVLWAYSSSSQMLLLFLVMSLAIVLMGVLAAVASSAMRHLHFSAWLNRLVTLGMVAALTFALLTAVVAWVIRSPGSLTGRTPAETYEYKGWTFDIYHDPIPLRIEDLTDTDYAAWSTEADTQSSPLLRKTEYTQQPRLDTREEPELEYTVVQVKIPALYSFTERAMLRSIERFNDPDFPEFWDTYEAVDAAPWSALRVYQRFTGGEPRNQYLLCCIDRLVEIQFEYDWLLTPEQMSTVGEKLKNA